MLLIRVLLMISLLIGTPVWAQAQNDAALNGQFIQQEALKGIVIVSMSFNTIGQPPTTIQLQVGSTSDQMNTAVSDASIFNWAALPPNLTAFKTAIATDSTFPVPTLMGLCTMAGALTDAVNTPPVLQGLWSAVKAQQNVPGGWLYGNCTDGTPIVTKIESYASSYSIPLVSQ